MADHITLPQNIQINLEIRSMIEVGLNFRNQVNRLATAMESRLTDSDYTTIEADLGLQAGQGVEVYTMITGIKAALNQIGTADDVNYGVGKMIEAFRRLGV